MKIVDKIDLTKKSSNCLEHPLIKLKNSLSKLNQDEAIEVLTNDEEIPVETLVVIANRNNLLLKIIESSKPIYRILLVKK